MTTSSHNYFSCFAFQHTDSMIERAKEVLGEIDFDTFVVTGDSGLAAGSILAYLMNKNLLVIRKEGVDCHDWRPFYGDMGARWVFLDDLVETGATESRVLEFVYDHITELTEILSTWCSDDSCYPDPDTCLMRRETEKHVRYFEYGEIPEYVGTYEYASYANDGNFGRWNEAE